MSEIPEQIIAECPSCKRNVEMHHDAWEDMYRCTVCQAFYYPEEIGRTTNMDAGVFHIGERHDV